jgi:hypothetical protein
VARFDLEPMGRPLAIASMTALSARPISVNSYVAPRRDGFTRQWRRLNGGAFALTEFSGTGEGAWTVPHLHRGFEESFLILDSQFTFTVGEEAIAASPGTHILVPRGTSHTISAAAGGGLMYNTVRPMPGPA